MRTDDFEFLARTLRDMSGLVVTPDKSYLFESRLQPVARSRNLSGVEELVSRLRGRDQALLHAVMEALTTSESFFFRDGKLFESLAAALLPRLMASRGEARRLHFWSAGCSSGQEAYSLAMLVRDRAAALVGWKLDILGTDISPAMIEKARAGLYSQFEVQRGLPVQMLIKYFKKRAESWQIDSALRAMVQFREHNLLDDSLPGGPFDCVLCRNVITDFDPPTRSRVLARIGGALAEGGVLILGLAETLDDGTHPLAPLAEARGAFARV